MSDISEQEGAKYIRWRKISLFSSLIAGLCILIYFIVLAVDTYIFGRDYEYDDDGVEWIYFGMVLAYTLFIPIPIFIISGIAWRWPLVGAIIAFALACLWYSGPIFERDTIDPFFIVTGIIFGSLFLIIGSLNIKVWRIKKKGI